MIMSKALTTESVQRDVASRKPNLVTIDAPITAPPQFIRPSPFGAMLAQFFGFGIAAGLWAGSIPFVSQAARMTTADIGIAFTIYTAAYILAMTLGGKLLSYVAPRRILLIGAPAAIATLAGLLLATSSIQVTIFLTSVGFTMGLMDLVMNTEGTLVEADLQRPILARLHCFASTGTGIGAIAGSVFALTLGPLASLVLGAVFLMAGCLAVALATPDRVIVRAARGGIWAAYSSTILILGIIFGIDVAGETAASIWSARLLAEQAPHLAVIAGIGVSFFCACQAVMRFMGDQIRRALGDSRLVAISLVIAMIGFAVVGASAEFAMSVIGFALVGIGTAMQVPCLFALSAKLHPHNGGAALSLVATIAGVPRLVAPWAFGEIASRWSTGVAFSSIAAACLIAIGLAIAIQRHLTREI
jgi:MFS family permease